MPFQMGPLFPGYSFETFGGCRSGCTRFVYTGGTGVHFAFSDFPSSSGVLVTFLNILFLTS